MIGPLPSPRHEMFAQAVASGMSASKGYALAYSRPRDGATRACAARLLTDANVKRRIAELRDEAAEQAGASLRVLIPALEERARAAIAAGRLREAVDVLKQLAGMSLASPQPERELPAFYGDADGSGRFSKQERHDSSRWLREQGHALPRISSDLP
jgi:hypothetical protein